MYVSTCKLSRDVLASVGMTPDDILRAIHRAKLNGHAAYDHYSDMLTVSVELDPLIHSGMTVVRVEGRKGAYSLAFRPPANTLVTTRITEEPKPVTHVSQPNRSEKLLLL